MRPNLTFTIISKEIPSLSILSMTYSFLPQMLGLGALFLCLAGRAAALDNGLARTPPMGWLAWERYVVANR